jgi:hypothetical protein
VTGFICDGPADLPAALRRVDLLDPADCVAHAKEWFSPDRMARGYERVYLARRQPPVAHHAWNGHRSGLAAAGRGGEPLAGHRWAMP